MIKFHGRFIPQFNLKLYKKLIKAKIKIFDLKFIRFLSIA
ncbi:hypothetical protein N206_00490 [Helicobacter pylori UM111]|nr:hypothetical protein N206_00490 [Helicobacter pylori UM111]